MRYPVLLVLFLAAVRVCTAGIVDTLILGDAASERVHQFAGDHSEVVQGLLDEPARRLLPPKSADWLGGTLAFDLKVNPAAPNYITLRFSGDDVSSTRLMLVIDGQSYGYLHLGDYDMLEHGGAEPQFAGRFFYRTFFLPESSTKDRTHLRAEIRSMGPIWGYGQTIDKFQKPMTEASRGIYRIYSHSDAAFVPPADEKQGVAPVATVRTSPGPEAMAAAEDRVNHEITVRLGDKRPLNQMQMMFLAEAWHVKWTAAYQNPDVIRRIVTSIDSFALAYRANPKLVLSDPATPNPDWFGAGPLGATLHWLAKPLAPYLDERVVGATDRVTRRKLLAELFVYSREWNARNRRLYTNQSMIKDLYGIYYANRGLEVLASPQAWPEAKVRRYLYEAVGLQPWLGSDRPDGTSEKPVGEAYYQLTARGLTKELGYVGSYGEVLDWVTKIYEATRPAPDQPGDPRLRDQLVKIALARTPFRHAALDAEGNRAMRMETFIGWRDNKYPGVVNYAQKPARDACALEVAAVTKDPRLVGYAQQMIADNQFFGSLETVMSENPSLRNTHGLLSAPDSYRTITEMPPSPHRLPLSDGGPDYVFTDEEDGVVALKHGDEMLYASLYWRARNAVNFLAAVHSITPRIEHQAIVHEEVRFTPSGEIYRRPNVVVFGFGNGGTNLKYPAGSLPTSLHAGEELPVAAAPAGVTVKPGAESVYSGKGDFYLLRYGDYLIAMNMTADRPAKFDVPADFAGARDLVQPEAAPVVGTSRIVAPRTTVILHRASSVL
jgi:hypothetical protein